MVKNRLIGCQSIKDVGGDILVQDRNSSVVWGMPGKVAKLGLASKIVLLKNLPDEIMLKVSPKKLLA